MIFEVNFLPHDFALGVYTAMNYQHEELGKVDVITLGLFVFEFQFIFPHYGY